MAGKKRQKVREEDVTGLKYFEVYQPEYTSSAGLYQLAA